MQESKSPLTVQDVLDLYFLENRARLLEVASFLDRVERAGVAEAADYRLEAFKSALALLLRPSPGKTSALQLYFSDPGLGPTASAVGLKATGAWKGGA